MIAEQVSDLIERLIRQSGEIRIELEDLRCHFDVLLTIVSKREHDPRLTDALGYAADRLCVAESALAGGGHDEAVVCVATATTRLAMLGRELGVGPLG